MELTEGRSLGDVLNNWDTRALSSDEYLVDTGMKWPLQIFSTSWGKLLPSNCHIKGKQETVSVSRKVQQH